MEKRIRSSVLPCPESFMLRSRRSASASTARRSLAVRWASPISFSRATNGTSDPTPASIPRSAESSAAICSSVRDPSMRRINHTSNSPKRK